MYMVEAHNDNNASLIPLVQIPWNSDKGLGYRVLWVPGRGPQILAGSAPDNHCY